MSVKISRMSDLPEFRQSLIPRRAQEKVIISLADTRVVLLTGPRQSGKTTMARALATGGRPYHTLDEAGTLAAAVADPEGFVRGLDYAIIDDIHRAPKLMLAIKASVDRDQRPGRFLLTGSANLMTLPQIADSLAGRMAVIPLLPLAQTELRHGAGRFLDRVYAGEAAAFTDDAITGDDLVDAVLRGGYPEAVRRPLAARRVAWLEDYLAQVLDRDVRDIASIDQLDRLPRLMNVLAEHAGQLINHASFGAALGLSGVTAQKYVAILERLFLLRTVSPWSSNRLSRLVKTPKLHFIDSGLLAMLRETDAREIARDRTRFGPLLETFVVSEILKLATWSQVRCTLTHFRTKDQDEVDIVLEDRRGRIVGIEVKAATTVRPADFTGLRKLKAAAGDKFVHGLVLHDHDRVMPVDRDLHAVPVSALWTV